MPSSSASLTCAAVRCIAVPPQVYPRFGDAVDASDHLRYVLVWCPDGGRAGGLKGANVERYASERDVIMATVSLVQHWVTAARARRNWIVCACLCVHVVGCPLPLRL